MRMRQLQAMVDRLTSWNEYLEEALDKAYDDLKRLKYSEMIARMREVISEQYAVAMKKAIADVLEKVPNISKTDREIIMEELQNNMEFAFAKVMDTLSMSEKLSKARPPEAAGGE